MIYSSPIFYDHYCSDGKHCEYEWTYDPEVRVYVVDNVIYSGVATPIHGGPVTMSVASTKGESLIGMLGLEMLHLDIDSRSKALVPVKPSKKRLVFTMEQTETKRRK